MNTFRTGWRPPTLALCVAGLSLAVAGFAADSAAPANTAPSNAAQGDAITAARREFEAMKAVRDPAQPPKGALPKMTMPELQQGSNEPRPWAAPKSNKSDGSTKKSANWLVDAMEKESRRSSNERSGSRDGRAREEGESLDDAGRALDPAARDESDEFSGPTAQQATRAREVAEEREKREVVNPLTRFLGEWMTPRDYAILKPGLDEAATDRGVGRADASSPGLMGIESGPAAATWGIPGAGSSRSLPPEPPENPYLEGLQSPPLTISSTAQVLVAPPPRAAIPPPAPSIAPAPPPTAPKPKIPEFAKPAQDEKYFKQLKRF